MPSSLAPGYQVILSSIPSYTVRWLQKHCQIHITETTLQSIVILHANNI